MKKLRQTLHWVTPMVLFSCCTCSPDLTPRTTPAEGSSGLDEGGNVELFSWWTSGGEKEALDALVDVHRGRVEHAQVENRAIEFAEKAREQLQARFARGLPPDLFQANAGMDLRGWVTTNGVDASDSVVEDLKELFVARGWEDNLHEDVLQSVTIEGAPYSVPVNVHRVNSLYYRKDLFEELNLQVPRTLDELEALCRRLQTDERLESRTNAQDISCLALGNKWRWPLAMMTFEMILPALAGPDFFESYLRGREEALDPRVEAALDTIQRFYCGEEEPCRSSGFFNSDINDLTWDEAVLKLSERKALMAPAGDWAKGLLTSKVGGNLRPGKDFGEVPFPGTNGTYVYAVDSFALPKGALHRDGARSFLATILSIEGQAAFNRIKGSLPARKDFPQNRLDESSQQVWRDFQGARRVPAMSALLPASAGQNLQDELSASVKSQNLLIIKRYLIANYPLD